LKVEKAITGVAIKGRMGEKEKTKVKNVTG
jgi:hypothetical protein